MRLLEDGQMIRDTYEVERFLGEGAFAEVYRVKHRFLGRQAMKVFKRVGMNLDEISCYQNRQPKWPLCPVHRNHQSKFIR